MDVKKVVGTTVLWLVAVPMLVLIPVLILADEKAEVDANSTTTGTVTQHVDSPRDSRSLCRFRYTVEGTEHRSSDDCSASDTPIGSTVDVNYVADDPGVGFLNGDKTWWGKLRTVAITSGVLVGIGLVTFVFIRRGST